jgi:hypothetical protein
VASLAASVSPAQAAAYRYWTYWQGSSSGWAFATAGPASTVPADGSVEGWRFAVTTQAGQSGDEPGVAPSFADICSQAAPQDGRKRVALVVDPGPTTIAPEGQTPPPMLATCIVAASDATGYQILRAAATVRTDNGLVCGVADYPTGECAPIVDDTFVSPTPSAAPSTATAAESSPTATAMAPAATPPADGASTPWATIGVVALLLLGAVVFSRRRGAS